MIKTLVEGDIVILDNTGFHKDGRRLLKKSDCGLSYLPKYSPDLNKNYWVKLKKFHSRHMKKKMEKWTISYREFAVMF